MDGATYEEALLSIGIIPDTVLILFKGQSLPQDMQIEAEEVEIVSTGSRG
ncbi:MAG TPA: thiamine S protein [Methanolinea sp.]|nr:thiamine S protein [Methanolinea sp.]HQK55658.1 thiamine S protein [Methanolinea sp.]